MKNPFKENNVLWIAAAITSVIAAGAAVWYAMKQASPKMEHEEHTTDYLQTKPRLHKKKTDLHDLHAIAGNN